MDGSVLILASGPWLIFQGCAIAAAALLGLWRARQTEAALVVLLLGLFVVAATSAAQEAWDGAARAALTDPGLRDAPLLTLKAGHWIGGALELAGIVAGLLGLKRRHAYLLAAGLGAAGVAAFGAAVVVLS